MLSGRMEKKEGKHKMKEKIIEVLEDIRLKYFKTMIGEGFYSPEELLFQMDEKIREILEGEPNDK